MVQELVLKFGSLYFKGFIYSVSLMTSFIGILYIRLQEDIHIRYPDFPHGFELIITIIKASLLFPYYFPYFIYEVFSIGSTLPDIFPYMGVSFGIGLFITTFILTNYWKK